MIRFAPLSQSLVSEAWQRVRAGVFSRASLGAVGRVASFVALVFALGAEAAEPVLEVPAARVLRLENPVNVTGRAAAGAELEVEAVSAAGERVGSWRARANADGVFAFMVDRAGLPPGRRLALRARTGAQGPWSADAPFFVYPVFDDGATLPPVEAAGRNLMLGGKPWGFAGLNYTRFLIEFSRRGSFERVADDLRTHAEWDIAVLRVPLHLGMIQPEPGVFPDHPRYREILRAHELDADFYELFEYFVALCGHHGIRVVFDWHEMPTDPYRYFVGGNHHDKGTDRPGKGIAWLVDRATGRAAEPGDPEFTEAIVSTNRWLARRFRGNGTVLGFEAPYNEPHSVTDSSDTAWRGLTAAAAWAVASEDPARLLFGMPPAWGHNNVLPSVTWQLPDRLTGMAPHYYLGNGPVAARPDAPERKEPWLARDVAATFDHSFAAVALPHSAAPYPVWNGESGEHGYDSFLPDLEPKTAAALMIEAQLVQAYAAGMAGSLGWTLTGHEKIYAPLMDIYGAAYRRFAPVFRAGPVDYRKAEVLFVQNPGAVPVNNGLNHACVPLARLALDLHLGPVHYMTDDQLLANGLVQISVGLEQVEEVATGLEYRAAIVDTRNVDARALALLAESKIPVLRSDDVARLTREEVAAFLDGAGVAIDRRTPAELQLIAGPRHLLVYRRSGDGAARIYPQLPAAGVFELVDEAGVPAFRGTADELAERGLPVDLPKWRTAVFSVRPGA